MPVYTSEIDQFLENFDHAHPQPSPSQRAEQDKFRAIYAQRDGDAEPS